MNQDQKQKQQEQAWSVSWSTRSGPRGQPRAQPPGRGGRPAVSPLAVFGARRNDVEPSLVEHPRGVACRVLDAEGTAGPQLRPHPAVERGENRELPAGHVVVEVAGIPELMTCTGQGLLDDGLRVRVPGMSRWCRQRTLKRRSSRWPSRPAARRGPRWTRRPARTPTVAGAV